MIVRTWEDAVPVVTAQKAMGKTIGFWTMSGPTIHDGYRYVGVECRKHCDFLVGQLRPASTEDQNTVAEIESKCDLLIISRRPQVAQDKLDEVTAFTKENHDDVFKQHFPNFQSDWRLGSNVMTNNPSDVSGIFAWQYYLNQHYFGFDSRVSSWKDGVWRFVHERTFPSFGCNQILVPPLRSETGVCYGMSNPKDIRLLEMVTNGRQLITSKDETADTLQNRLYKIDWSIQCFEKYSGPLLSRHEEEGDTYFHIILKTKHGTYTDGFLL